MGVESIQPSFGIFFGFIRVQNTTHSGMTRNWDINVNQIALISRRIRRKLGINLHYKAGYILFSNWTNREQNFFRRTKYCLRKQGECAALHCSLFAVSFRRNIFATGSTKEFLFFGEKLLYIRRRDRYLGKILRIVYGEKPVHKTWRTPTIHYSLHVLILSLFRRCSLFVNSVQRA